MSKPTSPLRAKESQHDNSGNNREKLALKQHMINFPKEAALDTPNNK